MAVDEGYDTQQLQDIRLLKRAAIALLCLLFVALVVVWIVHYLTTGRVIITSSDKYSTISLSTTSGSPLPQQGHSKLVARLKAGRYVANVTGGSLGTSKVITVKARQTAHYILNPVQASGIEPVLDDTATAVAADSSQLLYINGNGNLSKINSDNSLTTLASSTTLRSVSWADTGFGVGSDPDGNLYTITNGSVKPVHLDVPNDDHDVPVFAVGKKQQIYVAVGNTVYLGGAGGNFKKIYTAPLDVSLLVPGNVQVAVISFVYADDAHADKNKSPSIAIVNDSGKTVKRSVGAFSAAFSPSGSYLAVADHSGGEVLDNKLNVVYTIPQSNFSTPFWLDNTTLLYAVGGQLWSYNINQQKSRVVANTPLAQPITELSLSSDGSYLYLGVADQNQSQEIKRIGLRGQKVADIVYKLQDILPAQMGVYNVSMVNFSGVPTVIARYGPGSYAQAATQAISNELQSRGFDLNKLRVIGQPQ